ncbi:MAG: Asp-tRNA(Asn)/Glu-tRNA(Gln) amidotransferase subunit GatC [Candidatus Scatovivens sp.]
MKINKDEIIHIAKLADLNLKPEEVSKYTGDLEEILNFAETINNVDTSNIDETIMTNQNYNVFRKDEVIKFENREELLKNAPSKEDGMFQIPKVIN